MLRRGLALFAGAVAFVALSSVTAPPRTVRHAPVVVESPVKLSGAWVGPVPTASAAARRSRRAAEGEPVSVELTAYCLRGTTRRGRWVRDGIVAADPRLFPLSRYVEVFAGGEYLGRYLIDDTGRLITGARLDLWMESCEEALEFGRQQGVAILLPLVRSR